MQEEQKQISSHTALIFIGVLVLLVISILVPGRFFGVSEVKKEEPLDLTQFQTSEAFSKSVDKNSDGSVSWREIVGEDFIKQTNISTEEKPNPETVALLNDPNNITSSFTKDLAVTSAYIKNNNITDEETQTQIMNELLKDALSKTKSKQYSVTDIKVAKTETKESLHVYGNAIGSILQNLITTKNINEDVPGLGMYLEKQDESYLKPLLADSVRVNSSLKKILSIEVPPSAVIYHLIMLNQVVQYSDNLNNLALVTKDPMRSAASIEKYPDSIVNTLKTYKTLSNFFTAKNIVFKQNEAGYIFTVGFTLE